MTPDAVHINRRLILRNCDGSTQGADPRRLARADLAAAGHAKRPILKTIRAKCLDCCADQAGEVAKCTAIGCALWPYRMGTNPFTDRPGGIFPGNAEEFHQREAIDNGRIAP